MSRMLPRLALVSFAAEVACVAACGSEPIGRRPPSNDVASAFDRDRPAREYPSGGDPGLSTHLETPPPSRTSSNAPGAAAKFGIYFNTRETLFGFDPEALRFERIGDFHERDGKPVRFMQDLAIGRDGTLYGGAFGGSCTDPGQHYVAKIDPATAEVEPIFVPEDAAAGLEITEDGMILAGVRVSLYDIASGTEVGRLFSKLDYWTSGDIVQLPNGEVLWMTGQFNSLFRGNPRTGDALFVRSLEVAFDAMLRHRGELWAIRGCELVRVLPATADVIEVITAIPDGLFINGAAVHPSLRD